MFFSLLPIVATLFLLPYGFLLGVLWERRRADRVHRQLSRSCGLRLEPDDDTLILELPHDEVQHPVMSTGA